MSDNPWTGTLNTSAEFKTALGNLLAAAEKNDIDIQGSWVTDGSEAHTNWEVMIYELE